jgi:hypothetical protein
MDRRDKANRDFVQFCEHAQKYMYSNFCCALGETPGCLHLLLRYGVRGGNVMDKNDWEKNCERVEVKVGQLK